MHTNIFGQTQTGKSTLCKNIISDFQAMNIPVIVYEPFGDPFFKADLKFKEVAPFLKAVFENKNCCIFVDECGKFFSAENKHLKHLQEKLLTMGSHYGHKVFLIAQRYTQIPTTPRNQANTIILFNSSIKDGQTHAEEWNDSTLKNCINLKKGEYIYKRRMEKAEVKRVF